MKTLTTILAAAAILSIAPFAQADVITLGNSGWECSITDSANVGVVVDAEGNNFVMIEILKTFTDPPQNGQFAPILIDFTQVASDANTATYIVLNDELVTNSTGTDWTDYHWSIDGPAAFKIDQTLASGFNIDPFTNMNWTPKTGWSSNYASALDVDGGILAAGATYAPGATTGYLVIEADLSGSAPASFTLSQNPTPEPATMLLMAAGLPLILRRRQRQRAAKR
ncbi:MAG: PEP-CTERM sorting domain-containing protein [bacterium]|nr:PEP-CTERM sorting domain-containing protein [bacterium]